MKPRPWVVPRRPGPKAALAAFSLLLGTGAALAPTPGAELEYVDHLSSAQIARLFPKPARHNVLANWPVVRVELKRHHLGDSKALVLYALATIRVEASSFSPLPERPSAFSKTRDRVTYAGVADAGTERPFGSYDSTIRFDKDGKPIVNKRLGNCYYRGKDDELMRARHGDPLLPECDDGERYRGRGFIQLTGRYNYEQMQRQLKDEAGLDLVNRPEAAGTVEVAAAILASFLANHRQDIERHLSHQEYLAARKIVNQAGLGAEVFTKTLQLAAKSLP
jgi:putative chitinase